MENPRVAIIGAGNIGKELLKRVQNLNWEVFFIVDKDGIYKNLSEKIDELSNIENYIKGVDLAFLAVPTFDDGLTAKNYIKMFLRKDIPVVTCEKGALGNYFSELKDNLRNIGYSATVGGGTRILPYLKERMTNRTQGLNLIVNGTLNFIFSNLSNGKKLNDIVYEAQRLGYCEPGAENALDIINKEALRDVSLKFAILHNIISLSGSIIKAKDIVVNKISDKELESLVNNARNFRYFISISKEPITSENIGGFIYETKDWYCTGGFKSVENNYFIRSLENATNGLEIIETEPDGIYRLTGPGAGAGPTASSMIKDAQILLNKK